MDAVGRGGLCYLVWFIQPLVPGLCCFANVVLIHERTTRRNILQEMTYLKSLPGRWEAGGTSRNAMCWMICGSCWLLLDCSDCSTMERNHTSNKSSLWSWVESRFSQSTSPTCWPVLPWHFPSMCTLKTFFFLKTPARLQMLENRACTFTCKLRILVSRCHSNHQKMHLRQKCDQSSCFYLAVVIMDIHGLV